MSGPKRAKLTLTELVDGVRAGDRAILGRAITLVESHAAKHQAQARDLLTALLPDFGRASRIGISGVPGVGKSTFIERFGLSIIERGLRVAVLAVDPSSSVSGGSILGDKTRMAELSAHKDAFIRPSPTSGSLGGVARKTRESMLVLEAAGFDAVLVETVGVGQSETVVSQMVDSFLVLMLAGAGDELQGIKRGILELADVLAVNKSDGDNEKRAKRAARELNYAMRFMRPTTEDWKTPVLTCSGLTGDGLDAVWEKLLEHRATMESTGALGTKRSDQQVRWMWSEVEEGLRRRLEANVAVQRQLPQLEASVRSGDLVPSVAAETVMSLFETG